MKNKNTLLLIFPLMAILQKVSFCKYFRINTGLFSVCRRKKIVFAVASLIFLFDLYPYDPPGNEKPLIESFKLNEYPERQNIIKFMNAGLYISSHCIIEKNKKYFRRNCGAWKPMDELESGKYKKYFTPNKVLPDIDNPKSVSFFICTQSGGSIAVEANEFGGGRDVTPLDFCQFSDKSLLALLSIEKYIRGIPNFRSTVIFD